MKDLRKEQLKNEAKTFTSTSNYLKKITWNRTLKYAKYALIATAAYLVLFQPEMVGTVVGRWIHDFFGTICKEAKF